MKYISLFYLPLLFSTSFLTGLSPEEKERKFNSIANKFQEYSESLGDIYQDRLRNFEILEQTYNNFKNYDANEALLFWKKNFNRPDTDDFKEEHFLHYLQENQKVAAQNTTIPDAFKKKIVESSSFSTTEGKASFLFEYLLNFHYDVLSKRFKKIAEGKKILPTAPDAVEKLTSLIEKSGAQISIEAYQERLSFLVKLFPLIDYAYLSETSRACLALDKNLMDRLEKRTTDMGHPDQGLETSPSESWINWINWIKILFKTSLDTATSKTKPRELKKLKEELEKRRPILFYIIVNYERQDNKFTIKNQATLNFEKLKTLPFQQQKEILTAQLAKSFSSSDTKERLLKDYENWIQEKKNLEKKEAPVTPKKQNPLKKREPKKRELQSNKQYPPQSEEAQNMPSSSGENVSQIFLERKTPPLIAENSHLIPLEKKEQTKEETRHPPKDRKKRKEEWEKKQNELKRLNLSNENKTEINNKNVDQVTYKISQYTFNILEQIYHKNARQNVLKWDDFVFAWRELRKVIDGVAEDEPIKKSGGTRKFQGGPLQDGKKKKARSFTIHEPHPSEGHTLGPKAMERIAGHFQNKFGWTSEKLGLTEKKQEYRTDHGQ